MYLLMAPSLGAVEQNFPTGVFGTGVLRMGQWVCGQVFILLVCHHIPELLQRFPHCPLSCNPAPSFTKPGMVNFVCQLD